MTEQKIVQNLKIFLYDGNNWRISTIRVITIRNFNQLRVYYANMSQHGFSLTRIFLLKNRTEDSVLIGENTCRAKDVFWYILRTG